MSQFVKTPVVQNIKKTGFTIKDTDFLMRLFANSSLKGSDIYQAYATLEKLKEVHERLSKVEEEI